VRVTFPEATMGFVWPSKRARQNHPTVRASSAESWGWTQARDQPAVARQDRASCNRSTLSETIAASDTGLAGNRERRRPD